MPTRATRAERSVPTRVKRIGILRSLPQCEITRIMLVFRHVRRINRIVLVVARIVDRRTHGIGHLGSSISNGGLLLMRQLAIVRPAGNVEIHVAGRIAVLVGHHVAVAVVDDLLDQIDHVDHVAGRTRLIRGRLNTQRVVSLSELALVNVRTFPPLLTGGRSLIENLVVDIGDVAHERDLVAQTLEPAAHHVKRDSRTNMADMRRALHGGATHVHADLTGLDRREIRHGV